MANEVKHPEEKKAARTGPLPGSRTEQFWQKYSKIVTYVVVAIILVVGGYFAYQNLVVAPEEQKASEAMWKAEDYYRQDSARLALNGDGPNLGFLKIISRYSGTKAANLSKFYAGASYVKLGDFKNAIKYLQEFKTDDKLIMVRVAGLLGDAYAETGKNNEAAAQYEKAGTIFPDDNFNSPEYLFRAGLLYEKLGKNKQAIDMYTVIKNKYPGTERGQEIDKYLGRLGELN
jgi:tetratricopeptide (TPR) repeat protein